MTKPYIIDDVTAVTFYKGGFFEGHRYIHFRREGNKYFVTTLLPTVQRLPYNPKATNLEITKLDWYMITHTLFDRFFVAEWEREYDSGILDGQQWKLSIHFKNGDCIQSWGNNAYPESFDKFSAFFDGYYRLSENYGISVDVISVIPLFR